MTRRPPRDFRGWPRKVYGVDFSGAEKAGKKIWIASGVIEGDSLRIEDCRRAADLLSTTAERESCLKALTNFIAEEHQAAFGLDFPFGLPRSLVSERNWVKFVRSFPKHYPSPQEFYEATHKATGGSEPKRLTDLGSKTPFSPINLRLHRQTYFGIRDVLGRLVRNRWACLLPMQRRLKGKPWVLEVCPASTLKCMNLYRPYKGRSNENYKARNRILQGIKKAGPLAIAQSSLRTKILEDSEGDALDSVIAAYATFRGLRNPDGLIPHGNGAYAPEGYVYV